MRVSKNCEEKEFKILFRMRWCLTLALTLRSNSSPSSRKSGIIFMARRADGTRLLLRLLSGLEDVRSGDLKLNRAESATDAILALFSQERASARSWTDSPLRRCYCKTLDRGIDPTHFKGAAIIYPSHMARRVLGGERQQHPRGK